MAGRIVDGAGGFGFVNGVTRVFHAGDVFDFTPTIVFGRDEFGNTRDPQSYAVDSTQMDQDPPTKGGVFTVPAGSERNIVLNGPRCHAVCFYVEGWRGMSQFNVSK